MPQPIPLHCIKNGVVVSAATGFLVCDVDSVWLTTTIHTITGKPNSTTDPALYAGATLRIVGSENRILLFDGQEQRFNVLVNPAHASLIDATSVRLSPREAESLSNYGAYETGSIVTATIGEILTYSGFPGMEQQVIPATTLNSKVEVMDDLGIALADMTNEGMSGAAVINSKGLVGIMRGYKGGRGIVIRFDAIGNTLFS